MKISSFALPFVLVACMAGCSDNGNGSSSTNGETSSTSSDSASSSGSASTGGAGSGGSGGSGGSSGSTSSGSGGSMNSGNMFDDFAGSGQLIGYTTNNPNSLPDIMRVDGRYRANLTNNTGNITLHFNQEQGRLDAKLITFPFDVIVRNIGIGTQADSQTAPPPNGNPYIFAGVQVHVPDLNARNSSHVVVGHRGGTHFTIEGKNTLNGSSSVDDDGANILPAGRADVRIVGNADRTLTVHWQVPNPAPGSQADNWNLYRGTGALPGQAPSYGDSVYLGLITYAFEQTGVPFVGTADGIEGGSL